jgi:hypothetical protein
MSYIADLKRLVAEQSSHSTAPRSTLREKFIRWFESLPAVSKHRRFAMSEFEAALQTQGKYLSPILHARGWRRSRLYAAGGRDRK